MLGEYLTALLVAVLGYVYPAYLCFKVGTGAPSTDPPTVLGPLSPSPSPFTLRPAASVPAALRVRQRSRRRRV
jgi:hypothetical protein